MEITELLERLRSEDPEVRKGAARALGNMGQAAATPEVLQALSVRSPSLGPPADTSEGRVVWDQSGGRLGSRRVWSPSHPTWEGSAGYPDGTERKARPTA